MRASFWEVLSWPWTVAVIQFNVFSFRTIRRIQFNVVASGRSG